MIDNDKVNDDESDNDGSENGVIAREYILPTGQVLKERDGKYLICNECIYILDSGSVVPRFVSKHIDVTHMTRDSKEDKWKAGLEFINHDGKTNQLTLPIPKLHALKELMTVLATRGFPLPAERRNLLELARFLVMRLDKVKERITTVNKTGWHGNLFVLPDRVIGELNSKETVEYHPDEDEYLCERFADSWVPVESWVQQIGVYARHNSRLMLALMVALCAPLLRLLGKECLLFHFRGQSSIGKTTAARIAVSVWGAPSDMATWQATRSGVGAKAFAHNDLLLALDEIGQVDSKIVGKIAYDLASGIGKMRAQQSGSGQEIKTWTLAIISTGEDSMQSLSQETGQSSKAGQEVRLVDVCADAGMGYGIFEHLHGFKSAAELADHLRSFTANYFGCVGPAFIEKCIAMGQTTSRFSTTASHNPKVLRDAIEAYEQRFLRRLSIQGAGGQVERVARKFALLAACGELATKFEITGWGPDESILAAEKCFGTWLADRGGTGQLEETRILEQVMGFFDQFQEKHFAPIRGGAPKGQVLYGYRVGTSYNGTAPYEFYVFPDPFQKQVCKGFHPKLVKEILYKHEILYPEVDKNGLFKSYSRSINVEGTQRRVYHITEKIWNPFDEGESNSQTDSDPDEVDEEPYAQVIPDTVSESLPSAIDVLASMEGEELESEIDELINSRSSVGDLPDEQLMADDCDD